jgi:NADH-quinone oxidoreductase subunit H
MSGATIFFSIFSLILAALLALLTIPVLVWLERRVCALIQDRVGPNRTNIYGFRLGGVVQSFADVVKLLFKEEYYPSHISYGRWIFILAPIITFASALLAFMVIPFADDIRMGSESFPICALPIEYGILWYMAISSVGVTGMVLGGWLSHNKYSLLGALRAVSQMIGYELALGLGIVSMIATYGTVNLNEMVAWQSTTVASVIPAWGVLIQPLAALIVITALFVETNRAPFSVVEGESEIVAGVFTEYSAMKFAMFFMGEYVAMNGASAIIVTLFFGGYQLPWVSTEWMVEHIVTVAVLFMIVIVPFTRYFISWMRRNNRVRLTVSTDGGRDFETAVLEKAIVLFAVVAEILALTVAFLPSDSEWIPIAVAIVQIFVFIVKLMIFNIFFIVVRWTLPRFRYDQIQILGWKYLLPLSLVNIFVTAIVVVGVS